MRLSKLLSGSAVALVLAGVAQSAVAVPIVFTDRTTWEAALTGLISTETFNGVAVQKLAAGTTTLGALNFDIDVADVDLFNNVFDQGGGDHAFNGRVSNGQTFAGGTVASLIDVDFGVSVNAFGADFVSTTSGAELQLSNGTTVLFSDHLGGSGTGFLGIIDTTAFMNVTFSAVAPAVDNVAEVFQMDDLSWASASSVPEPATLALLGVGLVGFAVGRRKTA